MTRRRALPALLLGLALVVVPAGAASAVPILDSADATELASTLAEASQAQGGICYGWHVQINDETAGSDDEVQTREEDAVTVPGGEVAGDHRGAHGGSQGIGTAAPLTRMPGSAGSIVTVSVSPAVRPSSAASRPGMIPRAPCR